MLDPFFSAKAHAKRLKRLAETNLTIHMLTSKESLSGQDHNKDSYSHYDLAYAIAKEGYSMTMGSQQRHTYYETALGEYYLLLKKDFYYSGVLESVLLLLAVLGYDNHCLALLNYALTFLEEHNEDRIPNHVIGENKEPMEWVYGMPPSDDHLHNFEDRLGVLQKQHQWCANSFLVPLFLVILRKQKGNETDFYLQRGARLGKRIEDECVAFQLPVLRSWSVTAYKQWGPKQARILLASSSMITATTTMEDQQQPNRWKDSCLLFWNILREAVHGNDDLNDSLTNTMQYMKTTLGCFPVSDEPPKATSWRDLFSPNHVSSGNLYCLQCRKRLRLAANSSSNSNTTNWFGDDVPEDMNLPKALRCSRSRVMYYCSTDCQRKNFKLTKRRGKKIHELRSGLSDEAGETTVVATKTELRRRYDLACAIVDLAYVSTDTIERGKHMYHLALLEYYQVLRLDFYFVGALESVLLLLCILGHDNHLLGLIDFVFYRLEQFPTEPISIRGKNGQEDDPLLMEWAQGSRRLERKSLVHNLEQISLLKGTQWCPSNFFAPLFFWSLKAQTQKRDSASSFHLQASANIGKLIECSLGSYLPFIRALFPDSRQTWCRDEAAELLALSRILDLDCPKNSTTERLTDQSETEHWENECLQFWQLLKEAVAFTPNLTTALEDTISYMEEHLQYVPFAEESSSENAMEDMEGFAAWAKNMSELESRGKLERVFPS